MSISQSFEPPYNSGIGSQPVPDQATPPSKVAATSSSHAAEVAQQSLGKENGMPSPSRSLKGHASTDLKGSPHLKRRRISFEGQPFAKLEPVIAWQVAQPKARAEETQVFVNKITEYYLLTTKDTLSPEDRTALATLHRELVHLSVGNKAKLALVRSIVGDTLSAPPLPTTPPPGHRQFTQAGSSTASSSLPPISSPSNSAVYSTSSSSDISPTNLTKIQKEISVTLHNHVIQTNIEIEVTQAYQKDNPNLSMDERKLLQIYIQGLQRIVQFEENMSLVLKDIEARHGSTQETLEAYDRFLGADSDAYRDYAANVKWIVDLSPAVSELLEDKRKLPGTHRTFDRFIHSLDHRKSPIRKLKDALINTGEGTKKQKPGIDTTIQFPADKAGGALYMQWFTRIPLLMKSLKEEIVKTGGDLSLIQKIFGNTTNKVRMFNQLRKQDEFIHAQDKLFEIQTTLPLITPSSLEELNKERARVRANIIFIRGKLSLVREWETNPHNFHGIHFKLSSRQLEEKVKTLNFWIGYLNTLEESLTERETREDSEWTHIE